MAAHPFPETDMIVTASLLLASAGLGVEGETPKVRFAPPVQLTAGGSAHTGILYPSPALHDVDGDGARELLIGEIFGTITVSEREAEGPATAWAEAQPMRVGGEPIKLNNW
ncbi:MAG: hypothetical protein AAGB93_16065 [Planctomycetota bacterium]